MVFWNQDQKINSKLVTIILSMSCYMNLGLEMLPIYAWRPQKNLRKWMKGIWTKGCYGIVTRPSDLHFNKNLVPLAIYGTREHVWNYCSLFCFVSIHWFNSKSCLTSKPNDVLSDKIRKTQSKRLRSKRKSRIKFSLQ